MDDTARSLLAAAARRHARELASLAYVILQNRGASEAAAAAGLADAWRASGGGANIPQWAVMVGATLRRALDAHRRTPEIDTGAAAISASLAALSPLQRAVAGGHLLASISLDQLSLAFDIPVQTLRREMLTSEGLGGSRERLRMALEALVAGRAFAFGIDQVESAFNLPPPRAVGRRRGLPWLLAAAAATVLVAGALLAAGRPPATSAPARTPAPAAVAIGNPPGGPGGAGAWASRPALPLDDRLTLADCGIQPAGTPLAFRGWLTQGDLSAAGRDDAGAGTPVYALVTRGPAEWVGWQTGESRAMYPRPVGRMACAVNPLTATATVFSVSDSWAPPPPMDGCPASPILRFAGDHQVGGPSAFVLLPFDGEAWWSKTSIVLRVRIAPRPEPGAPITATARLLDGSRAISLPVDSPPATEAMPPTSNYYLWLRPVRFPTDGCWLVTVAVNGAGAGAAILPISAPPD